MSGKAQANWVLRGGMGTWAVGDAGVDRTRAQKQRVFGEGVDLGAGAPQGGRSQHPEREAGLTAGRP